MSLTIAEQLIILPETNQNISYKVKSTNLLGLIYFKKGDYTAAEQYLLESLALSQKTGGSKLIYTRLDNLTAVYSAMKDFKKAMYYLQQSIEQKETVGNHQDLSRGYIQLSSLLFDLGDIKGGKEALIKSKFMIRKYKQDELLMHWHYAMGMQYKREANFKAALSEYTMSIRYSVKFKDPTVTAKAYSNQGSILMEQKKIKESEKKFTASLEIAKKYSLPHIELVLSVNLANIALDKNELLRARKLFEYVSGKSAQLDNPMLKTELAELSARLNKYEGNYKDALASYEVYLDHYKKGFDSELNKSILDIQAKYENEKKERELENAKLKQIESELKTLRAEQALQTSEKKFRALIENGTDIIYIIDNNLRPYYASPAAFHALGYNENEPWTHDTFTLLHPDDIPVITEKIKQVLKKPGIPVYGQIRLPKKNGDYIWVEGTATNLFHVDGANGIVCNLRDITERKQAEAAIKELNETLERKIAERTSELKDANKGLESFSYSVSHDLCSPLRVISGYTGLLQKKYGDSLNEEAITFLASIKDNANHMSHLIDDLLNLSRLGRHELSKTTIDMHQIIAESISELTQIEDNPLLHNILIKDIKLTQADPSLIKQVWLNLISNAIKYTKKKRKPKIEIGSMKKDNKLVYYIADNGAGFDMAHSDKLFVAFQRLHDKSEFEGTGVGLAIAHQIVMKHGGHIWAEGKVNKGATFYFTLDR